MMTNRTSKIFLISISVMMLLLSLAIALSNENTVLNWFLTDDAFYYFQVARNVSEGNGFSMDGVNLSNGFHPLWMFVCIPVFAFARYDLMLPLRIMVVILGMLQLGSFVFLFKLLQRYIDDRIAALVAMAWLWSPLILNNVFQGGVEAGLSAFFILYFWERLTAFNAREAIHKKQLKDLFWLGLIGALTIFSRLDNVFLVLAGSIWLWLRWWYPSPEVKGNTKANWWWRIQTGVAFNGMIVFLVGVYLAWNKLAFGSFMPISGQVKLWWGKFTYTIYGRRVANVEKLFNELLSNDFNEGPWAILFDQIRKVSNWVARVFDIQTSLETHLDPLYLSIIALISLILLALFIFQWKRFTAIVFKMGLIPFFLGTLTQAAYYKKFGSIAQREWYWVGENIFIYLGVALVLDLILWKLISAKKLKQSFSIVALIVVAALGLMKIQSYRNKIISGSRSEAHEYSQYSAFLHENIHPGAVIGMTGSGAWAYFNPDYRFINLDGLINSFEYFELLKAQDTTEYFVANKMEYVIGRQYILTKTFPYMGIFKDHLELEPYRFSSEYTHLEVWRFVP